MVDFGLVPELAIDEVRALQGEITALLIASIRDLEQRIASTRARGPRATPNTSP
jgi:hypothetical protein